MAVTAKEKSNLTWLKREAKAKLEFVINRRSGFVDAKPVLVSSKGDRPVAPPESDV